MTEWLKVLVLKTILFIIAWVRISLYPHLLFVFMLNFKIHFYELKLKIYYFIHSLFSSFVISYFFAPNLINVLSNPFLKFVITNDSDFIFTNIFEVFTTYYTIALYFCCFFSVPLGVYFSFSFIKAGLFKYERDFFFFWKFIYIFFYFFDWFIFHNIINFY